MSVPALKEQHDKWAAARNRFFNPAPRPKVRIIAPHIASAPVIAFPKEWVEPDAHVKQYERRLVDIAANPAKVYQRDRCAEMGVSHAEVAGGGRRREITRPRHILMWEVLTKFGLSFPATGRLFGARDHTTVLYAVRKVERLIATGELLVSPDGRILWTAAQ